MRKFTYTFLALIFLSLSVFGQDQTEYRKLVEEGDKYYAAGEFAESARKYSEAFVAFGNKGYTTDRYNAACSYALSDQIDSAFVQLFKIARNGNYSNYNHLTSDPDLKSLYEDKRWEEVKVLVKQTKEKLEENLDKELVQILDSVYITDQKFRMEISEMEKEFGRKSKEVQQVISKIMYWDSVNLEIVKEILDERGWLGPDIIGRQGNSTLFLVVQHADLESQIKYLPMMRDAVEKGNASASSLALLEDRVALRQGNLQTYGSQIGRDQETGEAYVLPLKDPDGVDERRASVGLGPLAEYVQRFGGTWDVEEYKKKLPEYIEREKKYQ